MMITQTAFVDVPPPWSFSIAEGNFDAKLIGSDLTSQGYSKETYGADTYYGIREDFGISLQPDNSLRTVMAHFNRVAVSDHRLIITPATTVLTPMLDALSGKVPSAISSPEVQAVSASMDDVLSGVVIGSDRVLQFSPTVKGPTFNFTIPSDWGKLHQYSMVGSGYRYDGKDHYWLISIYYPDRNAAAADAPELVKRINSYVGYVGERP